jgi:peroxiredoxin
VLTDLGNEVAGKFGLSFKLPDELVGLYAQFGIDLARFNGDKSWTLPLPGRFVIDTNGKIVDKEVHPDYSQRPEPTDIRDILVSMKG